VPPLPVNQVSKPVTDQAVLVPDERRAYIFPPPEVKRLTGVQTQEARGLLLSQSVALLGDGESVLVALKADRIVESAFHLYPPSVPKIKKREAENPNNRA
jgi:hypothetical protein